MVFQRDFKYAIIGFLISFAFWLLYTLVRSPEPSFLSFLLLIPLIPGTLIANLLLWVFQGPFWFASYEFNIMLAILINTAIAAFYGHYKTKHFGTHRHHNLRGYLVACSIAFFLGLLLWVFAYIS